MGSALTYVSHEVASHRTKVFPLAIEHDEGPLEFQVGYGHGAEDACRDLSLYGRTRDDGRAQVRLNRLFDRFGSLKVHGDFQRIAALTNGLLDELACARNAFRDDEG